MASADAGPSASHRMTVFWAGWGERATASADAGPSASLRMTSVMAGWGG